jgi:hypothetical protein
MNKVEKAGVFSHLDEHTSKNQEVRQSVGNSENKNGQVISYSMTQWHLLAIYLILDLSKQSN